MIRHRRIQTTSFKDRLASFAKAVREKAWRLPPGTERDALLEKAKKADAATHLDDWVNSPGLQPPK
jgi:leucyl aminopeptidase